MSKIIYIVSTPIGNLKDISIRALDTLKTVDYIFAEDTRRIKILLDRYGIKTPTVSLHKFNEHERLSKVKSILDKSSSIALVSDAGTPLISDPGAVIVDYALDNQIPVCPIPGASSLTTLMSVSGFSTLKHDIVFTGFLPHTSTSKKKKLTELLSQNQIIVFFESPKRILKTLNLISEISPNSIVVIGRELTKIYEEIIRFKASKPPDKIKEKGEFTIVVKTPNKGKKIRKISPKSSLPRQIAIMLANYLKISTKEAYDLLVKLRNGAK